jgi:hypothetical protein
MCDGFLFYVFDEQTGRLREQKPVTMAVFRGQKNKKQSHLIISQQ